MDNINCQMAAALYVDLYDLTKSIRSITDTDQRKRKQLSLPTTPTGDPPGCRYPVTRTAGSSSRDRCWQPSQRAHWWDDVIRQAGGSRVLLPVSSYRCTTLRQFQCVQYCKAHSSKASTHIEQALHATVLHGAFLHLNKAIVYVCRLLPWVSLHELLFQIMYA